jgi:hypothetical protein
MRKNNCELIRRELDELMPGEPQSSAATQHLRECASCREFHEQTTKLRQIVGSLGTVEAPADFDFRLRARLAQDNGSSVYWPFARRGLAVAAMVLVFATGAVVVRNVLNEPPKVDEVAVQPETRPAVKPDEAPPVVKEDDNREPPVATAVDSGPQNVRKPLRRSNDYKKRQVASVDFSSERAEVIGGVEPVGVSAAFPIDASLQPFKVSLNDDRGNAKTISVPTISFGSQRIVQTGNQFSPKRDW